MKAFSSAVIAAILVVCLCPALAFAQDDVMSGNNLIAGSFATQADQGAALKKLITDKCDSYVQEVSSSSKTITVDISSLGLRKSSDEDSRIQQVLWEIASTPEYFYVSTVDYGTAYDSRSIYTSVTLSSIFTPSEIANARPKYNEALEKMLSSIAENADSTQKAKAVHDWLVNNCTYDLNAPNLRSAYGALVDNRAVCQGYSFAFMTAMNKLGIPCVYVGQETANHGWNQVKLNEKWYNVDVTMDDPAPSNKYYFLKSDEWMVKNHSLVKDYAVSTWYPASQGASDKTYDSYLAQNWQKQATGGDGQEPSNGSTDDGSQGSSAKTPTATKQQSPITVKGKTIKVKLKNLKKKKKITFASAKAFTISNAIGTVSFNKKFGVGKIVVANNGKVTVKKGLKKGKYGVIVAINTTGSLTYTPQSATATFTVQVK